MPTMSPALASSPLARFTPDELTYNSGDRIPRDASGKPLEWTNDILHDMEREQAAKQATAARYLAETGIQTIEPPTDPLPASFYEARDWTRHIMQRADYMGMAREGLLAATLAVMSSRIPANVKAQLTGRDVLMPLNLYVNLTGVTGSGKSRAVATAKRLMGDEPRVLEINPASGEAIAAQYVERAKDGDTWTVRQKSDRALMVCTEISQVSALAGRTGSTLIPQAAQYVERAKDGDTWTVRQKSDRALMVCTEISQVSALAGRTGSTLIPQLLHAYSGETLGATTKTKELDLRVRAGLYRFSAIFGVQPANAAVFVSGGVTNGFSGGCVYFSSNDAQLAARIDEDAPEPTQPWPDIQLPDGSTRIAITYPATARRYAMRLIRKSTAGIVSETDGHRAENMGRIAALYALADGRTVVSEDDWALATTLMRRSDAVRAWLFDRYADECVKSEAAHVETKNAARDEADERTVTRVCKRIVTRLKQTNEELTRQKLSRFLGRDRKYIDAAIEKLHEEKIITVNNGYDDGPTLYSLSAVE